MSAASAVDLLKKAIEFDVDGRHMEALKLYRSGIGELLAQCKAEPDAERKRHFQAKIEEYMLRAEQVKKLLPVVGGHVIDKVHIMEGETGNDYETVFGKYLTAEVTEVQLEEPYLREHYQMMNLLRFCELVVLRCRNVRTIQVTTTTDPRPQTEQTTALAAMAKSLLDARRVRLDVRYSETLHDRQIILDNGYVIKIGRGLNYFKPVANKYSLGYFDYRLRACKQCNVDILYCEENKRSAI